MTSSIAGLILCGDPYPSLGDAAAHGVPSLFSLKEGYRVLDKQIFEFKYAGISSVTIVASSAAYPYLREAAEAYEGLEVTVLEEPRTAGSVGALLFAREQTEGDLLVRNADIVSDINMRRFVAHAQGSFYGFVMYITRLPSPYGIVHLQGDHIVGFEEKPLLDAYINAGIYYVKRDTELPQTYQEGKLEYTLFPELARSRLMGSYQEDVFWRSLKTWRDLDAVRKEYECKTDKAWGYEKLLVKTDQYMTKELFLREGFHTSYHQHEQKDETMFVTAGRGYIKFDGRVEHFTKNDKIHISPKVPHSIVALENTLLYEFSTPHPRDTTRLEDYYPRDTE